MRHMPVLVLSLFAIAACNQGTGPAKSDGGSGGAAAPAAMSDADKQKALAALPAPYNTGDLANGEAKFALCRSCHTTNAGGANMTGPNLHGVFGRKTAGVEGYKYSDALKAANFVWDGAKLDEWLTKPQEFMPGTKMTFPGVKDAKDRTDLIAYIMVETSR